MNQTLDLTDALEQIKAELESHLITEINKNRKNGKSTKTMKSSVGEFELDIPRDRNGSYEPPIVKKHQTHMSEVKGKNCSKFCVLFSVVRSHNIDFIKKITSTLIMVALTFFC
ncbi:MAG: transposase [Malaciobacter mytili]